MVSYSRKTLSDVWSNWVRSCCLQHHRVRGKIVLNVLYRRWFLVRDVVLWIVLWTFVTGRLRSDIVLTCSTPSIVVQMHATICLAGWLTIASVELTLVPNRPATI